LEFKNAPNRKANSADPGSFLTDLGRFWLNSVHFWLNSVHFLVDPGSIWLIPLIPGHFWLIWFIWLLSVNFG
jgi:hypothetical protein